jgi:hypothetical protein
VPRSRWGGARSEVVYLRFTSFNLVSLRFLRCLKLVNSPPNSLCNSRNRTGVVNFRYFSLLFVVSPNQKSRTLWETNGPIASARTLGLQHTYSGTSATCSSTICRPAYFRGWKGGAWINVITDGAERELHVVQGVVSKHFSRLCRTSDRGGGGGFWQAAGS